MFYCVKVKVQRGHHVVTRYINCWAVSRSALAMRLSRVYNGMVSFEIMTDYERSAA